MDFANIPIPVQNARFNELADIMDIIMKAIAMESNMPQIPDKIIVYGDRSQNASTQVEFPLCTLSDTKEHNRYARTTSPMIIGCLRRK